MKKNYMLLFALVGTLALGSCGSSEPEQTEEVAAPVEETVIVEEVAVDSAALAQSDSVSVAVDSTIAE